MRKFVTMFVIIATGIYLISISCLVFYSLLVRHPYSQPAGSTGFFLIFRQIAGFFLGLLVLLTGISLFRRRQWSRYSLLFLSAWAVFFGLMLVGYFFINFAISSEPYYIRYPEKVFMFVFWFMFFIAIPIFCLTFFTRKWVSGMFLGRIPSFGGRPAGILFLSILMGLGAFFSGMNILFKSLGKEILLGSILVPSLLARAYWIVHCAVSAFAAVGLWRMKRSGWIAAMALQVFNILALIAAYFMMTDYNIAMQFALVYNINDFTRIPYALVRAVLVINAIIPFSTLVYLIVKKNSFIRREHEKIA